MVFSTVLVAPVLPKESDAVSRKHRALTTCFYVIFYCYLPFSAGISPSWWCTLQDADGFWCRVFVQLGINGLVTFEERDSGLSVSLYNYIKMFSAYQADIITRNGNGCKSGTCICIYQKQRKPLNWFKQTMRDWGECIGTDRLLLTSLEFLKMMLVLNSVTLTSTYL